MVGGAGGGSLPPVSALQPLTTRPANIIAAYAFNEPAAACNVDRSGKGHDFVTASYLASEMANVPDLIPGKAAVIAAGNQLYASAPRSCKQVSQDWAQYGELTVCWRNWMCAPVDATPHCFAYANAADTTNGSVAFELACDSGHRFTYYAENMKAGIAFSTSWVCTPNEWQFIMFKRLASGVVRIGRMSGKGGKDVVWETSGALALPSSSTIAGSSVSFGRTSYDAQPGSNAWADWQAWNVALTDAECEAHGRVAMASAP